MGLKEVLLDHNTRYFDLTKMLLLKVDHMYPIVDQYLSESENI